MKKIGLIIVFIIFIVGVLCIQPNKYYKQQGQIYQARYNNANTGPLIFHVPTDKELNNKCAVASVSCDIRSHHAPCYVDQFGNWWQNGENMQYASLGAFYNYHCSLSDTKLTELNRKEEDFFKKNGVTITEYEYKKALDASKRSATNSRLKNALKFTICYFLLISIVYFLIALWKKLRKTRRK